MELKVSSKEVEVKNFGSGFLTANSIVEGEIMDANIVGDTILAIFNERKIKNKNVIISISGRNIIFKNALLNVTGEGKISETLEYEWSNYIAYEKDEIYYDYDVLGEHAGQTELLIVAAKREVIATRVNLLKSLGFAPLVVEPSAISVQNAYERLVGPITDPAFIVDIGEDTTSFSVIVDNVPRSIREIPMGGKHYSDVISKAFKVNLEAAESMKINKNSDKNFSDIFETTNQNFATQIKRSLDALKGDEPIVVRKGILTGGGALTPGLADFLKNSLELSEVEIFNPVDYLKIPPKFKEEMEQFGPALGVVSGLALRKVK